ncbi:MAG: hypothetical protein JNG83_05715 [Opitutaceae bacterium]|nr:hypothetical protein [Opitutaceae bacterium]
MPSRPPLIAALLLLLALAGCRDRTITSYRAPKDPPPPAPPASAPAGLPADHPPIASTNAGGDMMANTPVATADDSSALAWTAPGAWVAKPVGAMRKGSYTLKGEGGESDLGITAFPGDTGGLEANLNRWRGQVGLPPASSAEVTAAVERFEANGLQFLVVDYAGNGSRLVGAIVPHQGNSWFFKLMGPDALVAAQKPAFLEFLRTVKAR